MSFGRLISKRFRNLCDDLTHLAVRQELLSDVCLLQFVTIVQFVNKYLLSNPSRVAISTIIVMVHALIWLAMLEADQYFGWWTGVRNKVAE